MGWGEGGSVENRIYYCHQVRARVQSAKIKKPKVAKKYYAFCHCKGRCEQRSFVVIKVRATIYLAGYAS
jgi:hypothetical protein